MDEVAEWVMNHTIQAGKERRTTGRWVADIPESSEHTEHMIYKPISSSEQQLPYLGKLALDDKRNEGEDEEHNGELST